jgi:uncharacterized membrane-anchored protein YhcB (DUF1043 family)
MIWLGIIIGFVTGVVFITLCYTPLVDKVQMLEQQLVHNQQLIDDAAKALVAFERENECLKSDIHVMQRMMPPEIYARLFDAPYRN